MRALLLLLMALTYLGHWPIQVLTGIDATVSYYAFRGALGTALFYVLADAKPMLSWRIMCYGGMVFEGASFLGGVGYLLNKQMPALWQGLLDVQTGLPLYWVGVAIMVFIAGAFEYESRAPKG